MVVLSELNNMFWGLTLEAGKRYEQTAERGFHISMACLEPSTSTEIVTVGIEQSKKNFILCCLHSSNVYQQPLDLNFAEGEEICFYLKGKGTVHLTGYMHVADENFDETFGEPSSEDAESSDEDIDIKPKKRKQSLTENKKNKKQKISNSDTSKSYFDDESEEVNHAFSDDDDDDDDGDDDDNDSNDDLDDDDEEDASDEEDEDEASEDDDDQSEDSKLFDKSNKKSDSKNMSKKNNKSLNTPSKLQPSKEKETPQTENVTDSHKKKKKNKSNGDINNSLETSKNNSSLNSSKENMNSKRKTLEGGVIVEEIKEGTGTEAKSGKFLQVFYTGKLSNGKIFDQNISGKPFEFELGKKEVIAGWEVGLNGMKVGGKRKLIIPPKLGYGSQPTVVIFPPKLGYGSQPTDSIPANSILNFEIELISVN